MNIIKLSLLFLLISSNVIVNAQSNKPVIGIGEMNSTVGGDVTSFRAMLETAIASTNKFELVERSRISDLLSEQALSSGGITQGSGQIGGISGVDYLIYGSITKLGAEESNVKIGNYKSDSITGVMSVDLRVVDVDSGRIKISETVEVESSISSGINISGESLGGDDADPLSSVQRLAADQVAAKISLSIFPIKVIRVKDSQVYLNYGSQVLSKCSWTSCDAGYLKIVELGEVFSDPDTGEILGADEEYIGAVEVAEAKSKFTIANILEGNITLGHQAVIISSREGKNIKSRIKKQKKKRRPR